MASVAADAPVSRDGSTVAQEGTENGSNDVENDMSVGKKQVVVEMPTPGTFGKFGKQSKASEAADTFSQFGLVLVPDIFPKDIMERGYAQAMEAFQEIMDVYEKKSIEKKVGTKWGYKEIVMRSQGRFEMNYKMNEGVFAQLNVESNSWFKEFFDKAIGPDWTLRRQSLLVSFPGAEGMQWHTDGDHVSKSRHLPAHYVNVFIALRDISLEQGPTELRPASHFLTRNLGKLMFLAKIKKRLHNPVTPVAAQGDAVIFDYRTLHRGTPNVSDRPRAQLELVFSSERYLDLLNFPKRSIFDV